MHSRLEGIISYQWPFTFRDRMIGTHTPTWTTIVVHPDVNLSHRKLLAEPKLPNHSNIRPYSIKQLLLLHNQNQDLQLMLKEKRETIFSQRLLHFYIQGKIERNYPIRHMLPDVRIQVERSQWCYSYLQ